MALSVLHAAGIVAQVLVKVNRLKLHAVQVVQKHVVLSQIRRHAVLIVQNHAVQNQNNANVSIVAGILSDK